jgi:hypothetical protein
MDRETFLKLRQQKRALMEQRLVAEWGESEDTAPKKDEPLKTFDEVTSFLLKQHFPKTTMWSNFVRKPPFWACSVRKPSFWHWSE